MVIIIAVPALILFSQNKELCAPPDSEHPEDSVAAQLSGYVGYAHMGDNPYSQTMHLTIGAVNEDYRRTPLSRLPSRTSSVPLHLSFHASVRPFIRFDCT